MKVQAIDIKQSLLCEGLENVSETETLRWVQSNALLLACHLVFLKGVCVKHGRLVFQNGAITNYFLAFVSFSIFLLFILCANYGKAMADDTKTN